ncbi:MAG: hypothetical protein JW864_14865 [Spirochaetes bacterium]|nr:hypothetical protein [Spirochaetota bacterium]
MNKDVKLMIELQEYWDIVLKERNNTLKNKSTITRINTGINLKIKNIKELETAIQGLKIKINENEVELSETDDHIKKLNSRKDQLKTEKEVKAIDNELEKAKKNRETLEENLITLYDDIEAKEQTLESLNSELDQLQNESETKISELNEIIINSGNMENVNTQKFEEKALELSPKVKARFLKFINSQNGKAIAKINGEICGACNFQVPFNLIQDLSKEDSIVTCTNCGRFIYTN